MLSLKSVSVVGICNENFPANIPTDLFLWWKVILLTAQFCICNWNPLPSEKCLQCRLKGVGRRWGRTDLAGFETVIFEITTFLIQKHFKTVTVTVILGKLIRMTFKTVIGSQWKWRGDCGGQDGNGNGNSSEFQDGNGNGNFGETNSQE